MNKLLKFKILLLFTLCITIPSNLFAGTIDESHSIIAQISQKKVTINMRSASLRAILNEMQKQSGMSILYVDADVDAIPKRDIELKDVTVKVALDDVLNNTGLTYTITSNSISITKQKSLPASEIKSLITGKVIEKTSKNPIVGATVVILGTSVGAITDSEGKFSFYADKNATIEVSFVGMKQLIHKINNNENIVIELEPNSIDVEDVIVTGYQTLNRRESASAVTTVKADNIMLNSKFSIDQMLAGQVPGLSVLQTSGEPGATPRIRIRGVSSIYGNKAPLWVLDGVVLEDPVSIDYSRLGEDDAEYLIGNAIAGVNPQDIETITVLKDASATAIYGVQAANGVIVVTTKKGKIGAPRLSYNGTMTVNQRPSYGDFYMMNATERIRLSQEIIASGSRYNKIPYNIGYEGLYMNYLNNKISYDEFSENITKMANRNTDWYDLLFRNAISHNHTITLSGGSDKTTYYASLGAADDNGTAKGSSSTRYTGTMKFNTQLTNKLQLGFQLNAGMNDSKGFFSVNPNEYSYQTARTIPCYNEDGSLFYYIASGGYKSELTQNIVNELATTGNEGKTSNLTAKLDLRWNIWNGISYEMRSSYIYQNSKTTGHASEKSYYIGKIRGYNYGQYETNSAEELASSLPYGGVLSKNNSERTSYIIANKIGYNKLLANDHQINAIFVSEIRSVVSDGLSGTYYGWLPDRGETFNPMMTDGYKKLITNPTISKSEIHYVSWIGSASYTFRNKYTVNANVRMDGSNAFGENPKYRFLPIWSVAGKYTISDEVFLKDNKVISELALRGSYGIQGNIDKSTSPEMVMRVGARNAVTGLYDSFFEYLPNPDLRWEKTKSYNIGVDIALFQGRITGTVDYYSKKGEDMIMNKQVSQVMGVTSVKINSGEMNNTGYEVSLRIAPVKTKDFDFGIGIIYSYNKNELTKANTQKELTIKDKIDGQALVVGVPVGTFYSYAFAGLNAETGYPVFKDASGRTTYEGVKGTNPNYSLYADDVMLIRSGVRDPSSSGGFDLNFRYKNLRLDLGFQYALGGHDRLPNIYRGQNNQIFDPMTNLTKEYNNRWRQSGDEKKTNYPVFYDFNQYLALANNRPELETTRNTIDGMEMYDYSDIRTAKTDNLRLRNLNISYVIPTNFTKKLHIESAQVRFSATNLFLITDKMWRGRDPESGSSNAPIPRTYSLTLNVNF